MANERTTQRIASAADPDIQLIQEGDVAAVTADFIVVQSENLDLAANPTVTVSGTALSLGAVGSGAQFEVHRVSGKQTVLKRNAAYVPSDPYAGILLGFGANTLEVGPDYVQTLSSSKDFGFAAVVDWTKLDLKPEYSIEFITAYTYVRWNGQLITGDVGDQYYGTYINADAPRCYGVMTVRLYDNGVPHVLGTHSFDYTYP